MAAEILASRKYAPVDPALVHAVIREQMRRGESRKDVIKRVKRKLHQVFGAYADRPMPFAAWLEALTEGDDAARARLCREIMEHHASTRERMAHLDAFHHALFDGLPMPARVIDLGCGLYPLARRWMPLAADTRLSFCDVHGPLVAFLESALAVQGFPARGFTWNLLEGAPREDAEVALLLKAMPCLEQLDPDIGRRLIESIRADVIVVSFPVASLGGRIKGMADTYAARFEQLVSPMRFSVERRACAAELVYRLTRTA